MVRMEWSVD
jgi:hypothetical protein